jgi:beta-glucanase (GH16 family)
MSSAITTKHYNRFSIIISAMAVLIFAVYSNLLISVVRHAKIELPFNSSSSQVSAAQANYRQKPNTGHYSAQGWTFNYSAMQDDPLSKKDWNFESGPSSGNYNSEAETYTSRQKNIRIDNGALIIEALKENRGGRPYTSARINTKDKFAFTYGKLDVTMKLPAGAGTWPAAWLLPNGHAYKASDFGIANKDPYAWALNGEIDFSESIGSVPGVNLPAAHSYNELQRSPTITPAQVSGAFSEYHTYGVIKEPGKITFTLDGVPYATRVRNSESPLEWPYEQPYYLILNLAIGGEWAGASGIDDSMAPWRMQVKSISYRPL